VDAWRTLGGVQEAFGIVIFAVVIVGAIVALITFVLSGRTYDEIGRGGLFEDSDLRTGPGSSAPPVSAAVRDEEIRQMLEARNVRRERRGEAPLDVEAELAALTRVSVDPAIAAEVRELVEARNARRQRRGEEPLDVEAEVARQLRDLSQLEP
jgi:hypothetical protein